MLVRVLSRGFHVSLARSLRAFPRTMPRTLEDFHQCLTAPPEKEGNQVRVAFIGDPNVGKSTIINKLLARDICTVSRKPHTTRDSSPVAMTTDDLQMVLVDTPGSVHSVHARKHNLPRDMILAPKEALNEHIDVLVAVIDASDKYRREYLSIEIIRLLHAHRKDQPGTCSVLALNKVDKLKNKRELLDCINSLCRGAVANQKVARKGAEQTMDLKQRIWEKEERLSMEKKEGTTTQPDPAETDQLEISPENPDPGDYKKEYPPRLESWPHFEKVFIVSALENDGIEDLKQFLSTRAKKGIWKYREEFLTDQDPVKLTESIVKSKLLDHLDREIPYNMTPRVTDWALDEVGTLHVVVNIECTRQRQVHAALRNEGEKIRRIKDDVREQMCNVFGCEVALKLIVLNVKLKK